MGVRGEKNIMAEIKARGPVACGVAVTDSFMKDYKGGVFEDMTGERKIHHVVSLLGWGTYWGENGFFKIVRGKNNLRIEDECAWAIPKNSWGKESAIMGVDDDLVKGRVGSTTHFLHSGKGPQEKHKHSQQ